MRNLLSRTVQLLCLRTVSSASTYRIPLTPASLGLNSFSEPCHTIFDVAKPRVEEALVKLKALFVETEEDRQVACRCREQRINRVRKTDEAVQQIVGQLSFISRPTI